MNFARYGIYFTPPPGAFTTAGASWLGWDIARGETLTSAARQVTERPRKYGFHATMKPPFQLAAGQNAAALRAHLRALCASQEPPMLEGLEISLIGSFLAFTACGDCNKLGALAARAVRDLDHFRAAPTEAELARRRRARLTTQQEENLLRWGYPHVLDSFRFHMTLTGPVPRDQRMQVQEQAAAHFRNAVPAPLRIDGLTLVGEDDRGFFHEIERFALTAPAPLQTIP